MRGLIRFSLHHIPEQDHGRPDDKGGNGNLPEIGAPPQTRKAKRADEMQHHGGQQEKSDCLAHAFPARPLIA